MYEEKVARPTAFKLHERFRVTVVLIEQMTR